MSGSVLAALLAELGISYRQFYTWCSWRYVPGLQPRGSGLTAAGKPTARKGHSKTVGYLPGEITPEQIARLRALAEASRIKRMPLDELADMIQKKQKAASH